MMEPCVLFTVANFSPAAGTDEQILSVQLIYLLTFTAMLKCIYNESSVTECHWCSSTVWFSYLSMCNELRLISGLLSVTHWPRDCHNCLPQTLMPHIHFHPQGKTNLEIESVNWTWILLIVLWTSIPCNHWYWNRGDNKTPSLSHSQVLR